MSIFTDKVSVIVGFVPGDQGIAPSNLFTKSITIL